MSHPCIPVPSQWNFRKFTRCFKHLLTNDVSSTYGLLSMRTLCSPVFYLPGEDSDLDCLLSLILRHKHVHVYVWLTGDTGEQGDKGAKGYGLTGYTGDQGSKGKLIPE